MPVGESDGEGLDNSSQEVSWWSWCLVTHGLVCRKSGVGGVVLVVVVVLVGGRALWEAAWLLVDGALAGEAGTTLLVESLLWSGEHHGGDRLWNGQGGDQLLDLGSHNLFGIGPCVCMLHLEGHRQHLGFWPLGVEQYVGVRGKC